MVVAGAAPRGRAPWLVVVHTDQALGLGRRFVLEGERAFLGKLRFQLEQTARHRDVIRGWYGVQAREEGGLAGA